MSRCLDQTYRTRELDQLTRQLSFAPRQRQIQQVKRAERLHDELDPGKTYPFDFLAYRITSYRDESGEDVMLVGEAVRQDLRLMIDQLSRQAGMPADDEQTVDPETLAQEKHVSTKTVLRWRKAGLRWRWEKPNRGGRHRLVICRAAVKRFETDNAERVKRASQFEQMDEQTREQLLDEARQLAEATDLSMRQVARQLAQTHGRQLETLRTMFERHDRLHPEQAIFADRSGPLSSRQKRVIERAVRMGVDMGKIAEHVRKSRSTVHRIAAQMRSRRLRSRTLRYTKLAVFERDDADEVIMRDVQRPAASPPVVPTDDLPDAVRWLFEVRPLDTPTQRRLLLRMHYLLFKADRLRQSLDRYHPRIREMDQATSWIEQAGDLRARLTAANLPIALLVARQHLRTSESAAAPSLPSLLETGLETIIEMVDTFEFGSDQTFDARLRWIMMRRFAAASSPSATPQRSGEAVQQRLIDLAARHDIDLPGVIEDDDTEDAVAAGDREK